MSTNTRLPGLFALGLSLALTGYTFVDPGPVKPTAINRYAEAMVRRMQQQGEGETGGLDAIEANIMGTLNAREEEDKETKKTKIVISLSLQEAVHRAVANNLDIRVMSFDPEISREEMIRAASVFDMVVFAGATYSVDDERQNTVFNKTSLSKTRGVQVGLRKHTTTGADLVAMYSLTRLATNSAFVTKPTTYEPNFTLEMTQPLLKGAWPEVNLAALRVARIDRRVSEEAFRERVEAVIADVVSAYWALHVARRGLTIHKRLLVETIEIRRIVNARREFDANKVHTTQAEAAVKGRQALVIRAKKAVDDIEDAILQLILGKQTTSARMIEIVPTTQAQADLAEIDLVTINGKDQLVAALEHNSQLVQAKLAVEAAGINVRVADKNLLPTLNLTASATWMGLDKQPRVGNDQVLDSKYLSYNLGLLFEYPLGNREAKAAGRRARHERMQSIVNLQNVAARVARTVNERVREVTRAHEELKVAKEAVAANRLYLKALKSREDLLGSVRGGIGQGQSPLAPEVLLNMKLQALMTLGISERDVEQAIADHYTARIQLLQVTGNLRKKYGVVLTDFDGGDDAD